MNSADKKVFLGLFLIFAIMLVSHATFSMSVASEVSYKAKDTGLVVFNKDNTLILNDVVTPESVADIVAQARKLDAQGLFSSNKPIYLFLHTPGGEIQSGLELIEALKGLHRPVYTVTSFAASMGFQIAEQMGERSIVDSGVLMSHHAAGGVDGEIGGQSPTQAENRHNFWRDRIQEMDQETVARTNGKQTMASYLKAYDHELWLTGHQAVAQGYADKVVRIQCDKNLNGVVDTHEILFMGIIPIQYDTERCPLDSSPKNIRIKVKTNKGTKNVKDFNEQGGGYGVSCLQAAVLDPSKVCAMDSTLTPERLDQVQAQFVDMFVNMKNHVIPMKY